MMEDTFKIIIKPTEKQKLCWQRLIDRETQFILFGGAAGGGKSWLGCEWLLMMSIAYPGTKWFVGRNELKRLMGSTFITYMKVCKHHNIPPTIWRLNSQYNFIEFWNGSRIDLLDVAYKPSDPLYERFGSMEYTSGWLEEAGEIKNKAFDVLKSRIGRHMNEKYGIFAKMLLTCNPKKNWIYFDFYKPWKNNILGNDSCFIQSLYRDNPFTAGAYGEMLGKIKDPIMKARLRDGLWEYEDNAASLIDQDALMRMFEPARESSEDDEFYLSVDVARFGRDKCVFMLWDGWFVKKIWYYDKSDMEFVEKKIDKICEQYKMPRNHVVVDSDGIGGGVVDHLPGVVAFVNGGSPVEEFDDDAKYRQQETGRFSYRNLRAQCYSWLAEYINEGIIKVSGLIDTQVKTWLIEELEAIRRKDIENNENKFAIVSKEDIKKDAIGRSCDFSDAMMMRCVFALGTKRQTVAEGTMEVDIAW